VRADVAITPHARYRKAALPTPSEPQSSWTKKRRDVPADGAPGRTFTSRPAPLPSQEAPSDREPTPNEGPVASRPTSGRNATPPESVARHRRGLHDSGRNPRHAATPCGRKASLVEKDLAFRLADRREYGFAVPPEAGDAGRPALGRAAAAREHAFFRSSLRSRPGPEKCGPTLSRTKQSLSPDFDRDNHRHAAKLKNPVSKMVGHAQIAWHLSTERFTGPPSR
jgi:hypothetical protein